MRDRACEAAVAASGTPFSRHLISSSCVYSRQSECTLPGTMLPEQTSILIVGAGPTGLSAAISLFNQGCKDILIVDAVERTPDSSRAMAIQAATLEVGLS